MEQFRSGGVILEDTLVWESFPGRLRLKGQIVCPANILVDVGKTLKVLSGNGPSALVQTETYTYNASVAGYGNIVRYDNIHVHPGHPDPHHRHDFDWKTRDELKGSPTWIGVNGWPTLGEFMERVYAWYCDRCDELPTDRRLSRPLASGAGWVWSLRGWLARLAA